MNIKQNKVLFIIELIILQSNILQYTSSIWAWD